MTVEAVERWLTSKGLYPYRVYRAFEGDIRAVLEVAGDYYRFGVIEIDHPDAPCALIPMP